MSPATFGDTGNLSDASPKCICGGLMCVWGMYPRHTFDPHVYISGRAAGAGCQTVRSRRVVVCLALALALVPVLPRVIRERVVPYGASLVCITVSFEGKCDQTRTVRRNPLRKA